MIRFAHSTLPAERFGEGSCLWVGGSPILRTYSSLLVLGFDEGISQPSHSLAPSLSAESEGYWISWQQVYKAVVFSFNNKEVACVIRSSGLTTDCLPKRV